MMVFKIMVILLLFGIVYVLEEIRNILKEN